MNRQTKEYVIFDSVTPQAVTSSTDASPSVVTKASHGLATNDRVLIYGHATNTTINGIFDVVRVDANTFTLKDINTGTAINGASGGAGTGGIVMTAPKIVSAEDFRHCVLYINTASSGNLTAKIAASLGKNLADQTALSGDTPNFGATVSDTNPYSFVAAINLEDGAQVEGDTGFVVAGTDATRTYEVNTNGLKYLTVVPTAWSAGAITVKAKLFNNS